MQGSSVSSLKFVTVASVVTLFVLGATDVQTYSWLKSLASAAYQVVKHPWLV
jgi:hypothetical protein